MGSIITSTIPAVCRRQLLQPQTKQVSIFSRNCPSGEGWNQIRWMHNYEKKVMQCWMLMPITCLLWCFHTGINIERTRPCGREHCRAESISRQTPLYTTGSNNNIGYVFPREASEFYIGARIPMLMIPSWPISGLHMHLLIPKSDNIRYIQITARSINIQVSCVPGIWKSFSRICRDQKQQSHDTGQTGSQTTVSFDHWIYEIWWILWQTWYKERQDVILNDKTAKNNPWIPRLENMPFQPSARSLPNIIFTGNLPGWQKMKKMPKSSKG